MHRGCDDLVVDVAPLRVEVRRVADRLRSMSVERLTRPFPPHASRAAAALALAQQLADASADLEGHPRRRVPDLGPAVVGDQVAVTGEDLAAAAYGRQEPDESVTGCLEALSDLRRTL
jgi:hypothetical protein